MIKPCDIRNFSDIEPIASKHFGVDTALWVREKLFHPLDKLFLFDENLVLLIEAIGEFKYSIHTIGRTIRVRDYKDFTIRAGSWMFDNTKCTCLIAFAAASNKRMQMFIGTTGGQRVGVLPDAGGKEDEIMYIYPIRDREKLERGLSCQQSL